MATAVAGVKTLYHAPGLYNINHVDAVLAQNGSIVFGMAGGDNNLNGLLMIGTLAVNGSALTSVAQTVIPQAAGGLPFTAVSAIDLSVGPGGQIAALMSLPEHGVGVGDIDAALLVQRLDGGALTGPLSPVSPAGPVDKPIPTSALVWLKSGGYAVFSVDATDISTTRNPITLQRFNANGAAQGPAMTVVADDPAGGFITMDRNPSSLAAATLASGRLALAWTESSAFAAPTFGQPQVKMQILRADGTVAVAQAVIDGTSAQRPELVALDGGRFVVAWLDTTPGDQGIWKAQVFTSAGGQVGKVFELSSTLSTQETDLSLVALRTGGFAATWRDMQDQAMLGRMFDVNGKATGNDFQILDTARDFIGGKAGMVALDGTLMTWMSGLNAMVGTGFVLQSQTWSTQSTLAAPTVGTEVGEALVGAALDDLLSGRGGNDTLHGDIGNDVLLGGSGRDRLFGGAGRDQLEGGAGRDTLTGGAGGDSFVFRSSGESGDRITDFDGAAGDRLVFFKAGFGGATGVLSGATLNTAHQGLFFETSTSSLSYDADGHGAQARVIVATLLGVATLAHDDLVFLQASKLALMNPCGAGDGVRGCLPGAGLGAIFCGLDPIWAGIIFKEVNIAVR